MAYVEPTSTIFKARYPEFDIVDNQLISLVLGESIGEIGESWLEKDRARAQMLLAAHNLSLEGEPQRTESITNGEGVVSSQSGAIIEMKDRDVSVRLSDKQSNLLQTVGNGNIGEITRSLLKTPYGEQYLVLLRRNAPSAVVV